MKRNFERKNTGISATLAATVTGFLHNNSAAPEKATRHNSPTAGINRYNTPHQGIEEKTRRQRQMQSGFLTAANGLRN
jgi:hypothetical protein